MKRFMYLFLLLANNSILPMEDENLKISKFLEQIDCDERSFAGQAITKHLSTHGNECDPLLMADSKESDEVDRLLCDLIGTSEHEQRIHKKCTEQEYQRESKQLEKKAKRRQNHQIRNWSCIGAFLVTSAAWAFTWTMLGGRLDVDGTAQSVGLDDCDNKLMEGICNCLSFN